MSAKSNTVFLDKNGINLGGEYKVLLCASVFYFRLAKEDWQDRIDSIKAAGYNCADIYFPWNFHEEAPGKWNFSQEKDADEFMQMCRRSGLYIIARPGPYICSEWDGGALPTWVTAKGKIRCDDKDYLRSVSEWFSKILPLIKNNEYDGLGGVILLQLENELDFFDCPEVNAYIRALRDMAKAACIEVPYFCCCGQSSPEKAGGLVEGVTATYNLYPDSFDNQFDKIMRGYALGMQDKNMPFLVSETNRDHFLLRRQLAAGAKLMGAYNQVAGTNFGFTQSVNNWGKPLSFITADYDFDSLVSSLGEYNHEIENAVIFAAFLGALGNKLAKALPYKGVIDVKADFKTSDINALALDGGGVAVCVPNFSDCLGKAQISLNNQNIEVIVKPQSAPFFIFDTAFSGVKIEACNCELYAVSDHEIIFHTDFEPYAIINGSVLRADSAVGGTSIKFISDRDAAKGKCAPKTHLETDIKQILISEQSPQFVPVSYGEDMTFEGTGTYRGYLKYQAEAGGCNGLFVEAPSDIVTVYLDSQYKGSFIGTGECVEIYEKADRVSIVAEKWGNSNFDDSRLMSMTIAAKKGISGLYSIEKKEKIEYCDFTLLDEFGAEKIDIECSPLHPKLRINSWNSTRIPTICAYSFYAQRQSDKLYLSLSKQVESAVYVGGRLVGKGVYGYVDLTSALPYQKSALITVVFRKQHWAVDCGEIHLLSLIKLDVTVSKLTEKEISCISFGGAKASLPLTLERGRQKILSFEIPKGKSCYITADMKDVKATFVAESRVVARMIGQWDCPAQMKGGNEKRFYLPAQWNVGKISAYVESVGDSPEISAITVIEKNQ